MTDATVSLVVNLTVVWGVVFVSQSLLFYAIVRLVITGKSMFERKTDDHTRPFVNAR